MLMRHICAIGIRSLAITVGILALYFLMVLLLKLSPWSTNAQIVW